MTHEPECFYDGERDDTEWRDAEDSPCICEQLTTSYQRGREDAAQQVHTELLAQFRGVEHAGHRAVVAAARGEGAE